MLREMLSIEEQEFNTSLRKTGTQKAQDTEHLSGPCVTSFVFSFQRNGFLWEIGKCKVA